MSEEMKTHWYFPSVLHMGDCAVCGNLADHPIHEMLTPEQKARVDLLDQSTLMGPPHEFD